MEYGLLANVNNMMYYIVFFSVLLPYSGYLLR